jgi:hypothetical protein
MTAVALLAGPVRAVGLQAPSGWEAIPFEAAATT